MTRERLITYLSAAAEESAIEALFLGGSHGRGTADALSDFDFIAVVPKERHEAVAVQWRRALGEFSEVVYWAKPFGKSSLVNAITRDWTRVDLIMIDRATFLDPSYATRSRHSQSTLRAVLDRDDLLSRLPPHPPSPAPDKARVEYLIAEFIRVLGLIAVGLGRNELVLGVMGAGLLRDLLTRLMVEETCSPERGGMLHLSRTITPEQMRELEALPCPGPRRAEILAAHWATAKAFFSRARPLAAKLGVDWPETFEQATREHLQRAFGAEFAPWWPAGPDRVDEGVPSGAIRA